MDREKQILALVSLCPEVYVRTTGSASWNYKNSVVDRVLPCIDGDPLKDLNAVHEAEKVFNAKYEPVLSSPQFKTSYPYVLEQVVAGRDTPLWDNGTYLGTGLFAYDAQQATAAQRIEAILRWHGKWDKD